jgi:dihydroflavonol-4-reductase
MVALVTGAAGFIGAAVVRARGRRGGAVRGLVEPGGAGAAPTGIEVVEADVRDPAAVAGAMAGIDVVYHLAAIYRLWLPDPRAIDEVNVEGTRVVLAAARAAGVARVVHTSSIAAIGPARDGEVADEDTPYREDAATSPYVRSKHRSEQLALAAAAAGQPVVIVNPAFPFGPGDRGPTPTGRFVLDALRGRVPGVPDGGFNAVDVDDVAEGHVLAAERGAIGRRYLLAGHDVTYREFYRAVAEVGGLAPIERRLPSAALRAVGWLGERAARVTGREPTITYAAACYAARRIWYDGSRARRELGAPRTPLRDTLARAIADFRARGAV